MDNHKLRPEKVYNEVDFGKVLENTFNIYKKFVGIAGVSFLLLALIYFALILGMFGITAGFVGFNKAMTNMEITDYSFVGIAGYLLLVSLFSGISNSLTAGIYQMAYSASVDKEYEIGTLFYFFKTKHFKELFLSGILIALITTSISLVFGYLRLQFLGFVVTYILVFFTVLTIPLIIFSNIKAIDAITLSIKLVAKNFLMILGLLFVSIILASLGFIGLCIGIFFTIPFLYATIFCIYTEILPIRETNIIDEIGLNEE